MDVITSVREPARWGKIWKMVKFAEKSELRASETVTCLCSAITACRMQSSLLYRKPGECHGRERISFILWADSQPNPTQHAVPGFPWRWNGCYCILSRLYKSSWILGRKGLTPLPLSKGCSSTIGLPVSVETLQLLQNQEPLCSTRTPRRWIQLNWRTSFSKGGWDSQLTEYC